VNEPPLTVPSPPPLLPLHPLPSSQKRDVAVCYTYDADTDSLRSRLYAAAQVVADAVRDEAGKPRVVLCAHASYLDDDDDDENNNGGSGKGKKGAENAADGGDDFFGAIVAKGAAGGEKKSAADRLREKDGNGGAGAGGGWLGGLLSSWW
jgi:hypothetical protein